MADPFSAIGTTIKLAEFCLRLKEVSSENRVFLNLIARVKKDLDEAMRERQEKAAALDANPAKRAWIDEAILDARRELNSIGRLVEDARIDVQQGKPVTLKHRFDWVLTNHQKFVTEERALAIFHHSLLSAMSVMHNLTPPPRPTMTSSQSLSPPAYQASNEQETGMLPSPFGRRPSRNSPAGISNLPSKPWSHIVASSALSLPEIEPMVDGDWTQSLLQSSSEKEVNQPRLSHVKSDDSIYSGGKSLDMASLYSNTSTASTLFDTPASLADTESHIPRMHSIPQSLPTTQDPNHNPATATSTSTFTAEAGDQGILQERRRRARSRFGHG